MSDLFREQPVFVALVWFTCAVIGAIVGNAKMAPAQGALLGLLLGPLGILIAFAIDARPQCGNCGGKVNGRVRVCQHCGAPNARAVDERHIDPDEAAYVANRREKRNAEQQRRELREIARQHEAAEQRRKRRG